MKWKSRVSFGNYNQNINFKLEYAIGRQVIWSFVDALVDDMRAFSVGSGFMCWIYFHERHFSNVGCTGRYNLF